MAGAAKNPFTPGFGQVPPLLAGRDYLMNDIVSAFDAWPGDPNLATIFMGARGTGKTVLLTCLSEAALAHGWVTANVSAKPGMEEDVIERALEASAPSQLRSSMRLKGVTIGRVLGVEVDYRDQVAGNWRTRMNALFDRLDEHDLGLLITIDEITVTLDEMIDFAATYQHFVREKRKVALLMAGLPYKVSELLRNDSVSFLRRAQQRTLGRIPDFEISEALRRTIEGAVD